MSNERFTKHYIDIINSTLSDTVLRNITMQANAQYVDELVGELNAESDRLRQQILEMDLQIKSVVSEREELSKSNQEVNNIRHQASQVETFRNQLIVSQKTIVDQSIEIEKLKKIIEDLQAPPKKKKTIVLNKVTEVEPELTLEPIIEDGGIF